MKTYKYEPLSERCIRLLSIRFDEESDPLRFTISVHSIGKPLLYKALSYVWGNASDRVDAVILDKDRNEYTISITRNLHDALRRLRSGHCGDYVWADAICINQGDNKEKTKQVRMMTEIYSLASTVFCWLGKSTPGDRDGFGLLKDIVRIRRAESEEVKTKIIEYVLSVATYPSWTALWEIFLRPWFRRIWIIQEIVVSKNSYFLCGEEVITGENLFAALEVIAANAYIANLFLYSTTAENRGKFTASNLYEMKKSYRSSQERSIQHFLTNSGKHEATDPRDKIFALIGLSDNVDNSFIDYELDGRSIFQLIQSLQLRIPGASTQTLGFGCLGKYFEDLPSWVCQWKMDGETDRLPLYILYPTVSALENPVDIVRYVDGVCHLAIDAITFDYIEEYVPQTILPLVPHQTVCGFQELRHGSQLNRDDAETMEAVIHGHTKFLRKCIQLVQKLTAYPTGQNLHEVLWRAYLFDVTTNGETPAPESYGNLFQKLVQCLDLLAGFDFYDLMTREVSHEPPTTGTHLEISLFSMILMLCWAKEMFPRTIWQWLAWIGTTPILIISFELFLSYLSLQLPLNWSRRRKVAIKWKKIRSGMMLLTVAMFNRLRDGRNFGITRKGYVGWFPVTAEKGDILCFLKHSDVPFVLRRTGIAGVYTLVGDSYIHGLMNGSHSSIEGVDSKHILIR